MALPTHGRCEYAGRERPAFDWPEGRRLAVYVAVNLEHFAWGEGLGASIAPSSPQPDVLNFCWREWGNRVGAWRLLDVLAELNLPVAVLANSALFAHAPELLAAYLKHAPGAELVGHGRTNSERQSTLCEADEAALVAESTSVLAESGQAPAGWLSPWIAESAVSPDLLAEAGYAYTLNWCLDDTPVRLRTRSGLGLLAVPYPQDGLNDIPAIVARLETPQQFAEAIVDAYRELLREATAKPGPPLVLGIALHPYIVAQPHRLGHLRRALATLVAEAHPAVWFTTPGAIHRAADAALPL